MPGTCKASTRAGRGNGRRPCTFASIAVSAPPCFLRPWKSGAWAWRARRRVCPGCSTPPPSVGWTGWQRCWGRMPRPSGGREESLARRELKGMRKATRITVPARGRVSMVPASRTVSLAIRPATRQLRATTTLFRRINPAIPIPREMETFFLGIKPDLTKPAPISYTSIIPIPAPR
jgi:hypothetical protein